jgi:hypothetical protein
MVLLQGDPVETLPEFLEDVSAGLLVTDFSPLRLGRQWRQGVSTQGGCQGGLCGLDDMRGSLTGSAVLSA